MVVKYSGLKVDSNNPVDVETIRMRGLKLHREIEAGDDTQNRMHQVGTAHLMEIMNDYDLLPIRNFKYGQAPEAEGLHSREFKQLFTQGMPDGCWFGCSLSCCKGVDNFEPRTGPYKGQKVCVDGPEYETAAGCGSNIGVFNARDVVEINFYCDTYGVDTISFGTSTAFAMECYENGILNKERTGGLELTWGNADAALELLHQMARGEGFGLIVGQGVRKMKQIFAEKYGADPNFLQDIGMEAKGLEYSQYLSKESLAQQGGYTLALKGPQHDEAWLIFMDMVNNRFLPSKTKLRHCIIFQCLEPGLVYKDYVSFLGTILNPQIMLKPMNQQKFQNMFKIMWISIKPLPVNHWIKRPLLNNQNASIISRRSFVCEWAREEELMMCHPIERLALLLKKNIFPVKNVTINN